MTLLITSTSTFTSCVMYLDRCNNNMNKEFQYMSAEHEKT